MKPDELIARVREEETARDNATSGFQRSVHGVFLEQAAPLLAEALEQALRAQEWQPIETAPRDGTWIQGWGSGAWCPEMRWSDQCDDWVDSYDLEPTNFQPTHWQPIPKPPTT